MNKKERRTGVGDLLLVLFSVKNQDGSAYTIALPYAEACGQAE